MLSMDVDRIRDAVSMMRKMLRTPSDYSSCHGRHKAGQQRDGAVQVQSGNAFVLENLSGILLRTLLYFPQLAQECNQVTLKLTWASSRSI